MVSLGRFKFYNWWLTTFPGLAILTVLLGFNFFGDGVRDAFDRAPAGKPDPRLMAHKQYREKSMKKK